MVSYHTGPALYEAVKAVLQDPDILELILVDNGNTEASRTALAQHIDAYDNIRLLQGHGNIGFSRGCNYGAAFARGDYLLFLNPDAVITPGSAMAMADAGQSLTKPWIVGGLLRDIYGAEQRGSRRRELTPLRAFATFTCLRHLPFLQGVHLDHKPLPEGPSAIDVVSGACMMMDKASFAALGGFDEDYFLHVEDIDICRRVRQQGGTVLLHPKATVKHYGSTSSVPRNIVEWHKIKGFIRYFSRYNDSALAPVLTWMSAPFIVLAIMGRAWATGLVNYFRLH